MKVVKFKKNYVNLNNCIRFAVGAQLNQDKINIDIVLRADDFRTFITIKPGNDMNETKEIIKKVDKEINTHLNYFVLCNEDYLDLGEKILSFLERENLI